MANFETERYNRINKYDSLSIRTTLLILTILTGLLISVVIYTSNCDYMGFYQDNVKKMDGVFHIAYGDTEFDSTLPATINAKAGEKITVTRTLKHRELNSNMIALYTNRADVSISLNNQILAVPYRDYQVAVPVPRACAWTWADVPDYYSGRELKVEITYEYDKYAVIVPEILVGTKTDIVMYVLQENMLAFVVCLAIFVVGVLFFILGLFLRNRQFKDQFETIGFLAIVVSIWSFFDTTAMQLFVGNLSVATMVGGVAFYLVPVAACAFLLTYDTMRNVKLLRLHLYLCSLLFIIVNLLQILGLSSYASLITVVHIELLIMTLIVIGNYILLMVKKELHEDVYVYIAIAIIIILASVDVFRYYSALADDSGRYTRIGIFIFFTLTGYSIISKEKDLKIHEAEVNLYKKLAFQDVMSGVPNRTAFERDLEEMFSGGDDSITRIVMIADVNNLKKINDLYGHEMGDDAIRTTAGILSTHFNNNCKCYRLGGDEFAVLSQYVSTDDFEKKRQMFLADIEKANLTKDYPLVVATGYHSIWSDTTMDGFSQADKAMYENKKMLKSREGNTIQTGQKMDG